MINMADYIPRKLRRMKPSELQFIEAAREERVFWRGDDIETYKRVYDETQRMRKIGARAYRAEAVGKLKKLVGGMV